MWGGFVNKFGPETCFAEKQFWGRFRQKPVKFLSGTILPWNAPHSPFGLENRWGGGFVKKFRPETRFSEKLFRGVLGKSERSFCPGQFCLETRHIVCLVGKIGAGWFCKKIRTENVFFRKNDFGGVFRQKWPNSSFVIFFPWNAPHSPFGPKNRRRGGFVKKFKPETYFSEKRF